jgi:hypothetical protein
MPESIPLPDLGWRGSSCIAYVRPSAWQKAAVGFTAERLRLRLRLALADEEEKPTQKKGPVDHYPLPSFSNVLLPLPPNSPPVYVGIPLASAFRVRNFQWHRQPSAKACAWPPPAPAPSLRRSAPPLPFPGNESGGFVAALRCLKHQPGSVVALKNLCCPPRQLRPVHASSQTPLSLLTAVASLATTPRRIRLRVQDQQCQQDQPAPWPAWSSWRSIARCAQKPPPSACAAVSNHSRSRTLSAGSRLKRETPSRGASSRIRNPCSRNQPYERTAASNHFPETSVSSSIPGRAMQPTRSSQASTTSRTPSSTQTPTSTGGAHRTRSTTPRRRRSS